ncbi:MAG: hypothetical protein AAF708_07765 [Deinococcota bacterium]
MGESTQLSWQVSGTEPISLSLSPPASGELLSPLTLSPTETTTYRLTASNAEGARNASVTVTVLDAAAPTINDFSASASALTVTFTWSLTAAEPLACTLEPGDGSDVLSFDNCLTTQQTSYTYSQAGSYTAVLSLASGARQSVTFVVSETVGEDVLIGGFVDEQSRNVIIIMTDEDGEQRAASLDDVNAAIAVVEASYGVTSTQPAIRGANAAVLSLLQQTSSTTRSLFNVAREFVVAVTANGEVIASSALERLDTSNDPQETRLEFNLQVPSEETVALLVAEPDGRGGWLCKGLLEYQTLNGQQTVTSSQSLYRFNRELAGNNTPYSTGRFQFNELTANLASRRAADSSSTMQADLPSPEVQEAIVSLADAPEFQDGLYRFCGNPDIARNDVVATIDWRSDIFNVSTLPPNTNPDLVQGEAAVYDFSIALLLESISEQDANGNTVTSNRFLGASPIDVNGNVNVQLVRDALDNLNATLFFTDVAFFDASKERFPLTPSYEFDAGAQLSSTQTLEQQDTQQDGPVVPELVDLGVIDGGLGYIQGQVLDLSGQPVAGASVIIVLDGERLAFNAATSGADGNYEIFIPSDTANSYILYAQNADASLAGLAGNDDTGVRFNVPGSRIFDQDIILDVPLPGVIPPASQQPTADAGEDLETLVGNELSLTGSVSDPDGDNLIVRWQLISRPENSDASLTGVVTTTTSFTPDVAGDYVLRLLAFDGEAIGSDTVTVTALETAAPDSVRFVLPSSFIILSEGGEAVNLILERSTASQADLTVQLQLLPGSSADASDIAITGATNLDGGSYEVSLAAGVQQTSVNVQALADDLLESSELLVLELVTSADYSLGDPAEARFIILDSSPNLTNCDAAIATTQSDIDALSNCQFIEGSLVIDPLATIDPTTLTLAQNDAITSLAPLSNLEAIRDDLFIGNTTSLTTLNGLDLLANIGGDLIIKSNSGLMSLNGLGTLGAVDGDIVIANNSVLTALNDLTSLTNIGGSLYIGYDNATETLAGNPELTDLSAINDLIEADIDGDDIIISANAKLDCPVQDLAFENAVTASEGNLVNCNETDIITPNIISFTASSNTILEGEMSTLSWQITGDEPITLTLSPNIGDVSGSNSVEVSPNATITYTLTATNIVTSASDTETVTITVTSEPVAPTIVTFSVLPDLITSGESSTISWEVTGTEPITVEIMPEVTEVFGPVDSTSVTPAETTLYTLRATNDIGSVEDTVTVEVDPCTNPEDVTSQDELDNLAPCIEIVGGLLIRDSTNIFDLSALDGLERIVGDLVINNNAGLTSLLGLTSLIEVEGDLEITSNSALASYNGMDVLTDVSGSVVLGQNDVQDLTHLNSLTIIGGVLEVKDNDLLETISGFQMLNSVAGLEISNISDLSSITGFDLLATIDGDLIINNLPSLASLDEFNFTTVSGNITITNNGTLLDLFGLENITGYNDLNTVIVASNDSLSCPPPPTISFEIDEGPCTTPVLQDCPISGTADIFVTTQVDLDSLDNCGRITVNLIINSSESINLAPLNELTEITGNLEILSSDGLVSLNGLNDLESVGGHLVIDNNNTLMSLDGFDNLERVDEYLDIINNDLLTSLDGLDNLESIGNDLDIIGNDALISLDGLDNLMFLGDDLFITTNDSLTNLDALINLTTIGGDITISENLILQDITGLANVASYDNVSNTVTITENENFFCTPPPPFEVDESSDNAFDCL